MMEETTVNVVFEARARMAEVRVNEPEDSVVTEMIKQFIQAKMLGMTRYFQTRTLGTF